MTLNAYVDARDPSLAPAGISAPATVRSIRRVLDRQARLVVPVLGGGVVAGAAGMGTRVSLAVVAAWFVVRLQSDRTWLGPRLPGIADLSRQLAVPFAVVGVMSALDLVSQTGLTRSLVLSAVMTGVLLLVALASRVRRVAVRVLVVGGRDDLGLAVADWSQRSDVTIAGLALVDDDHHGNDGERDLETFGLPVRYGLDDVAGTVERLDVDIVVVLPSPTIESADVRRLGWLLERSGTTVAVRTHAASVAAHRLSTTVLAGSVVTEIGSSRAPAHVRCAKAVIDRIVGTALLVALAPVLLLAVVAIRLESPGPGLFSQIRIGRDGRPFRVYKLRTMCTEAEDIKADLGEVDEGNGVLFKIRQDPRITRLGRLLRKTSLDELPQLINVVRGEMSLVGPRPALPQEVDQYDETVRRRLAVRPGMTGLWQVSGRSDLDWDTSVDLDLHYTDNLSIAEDVRICVRTVGAVTSGRGAY